MGNSSFQIMEKVGRRNRLVKHLGTTRNSLEENQLKELGQQFWIVNELNQENCHFLTAGTTKIAWEEFLSNLSLYLL